MKSKIEKLMLGFSLLPLSLSAVAYDKADERIIDQHMQIVVDSIKAKQIAPIMALMPPQIFVVIGERFDMDAATLKTHMIQAADDTFKDIATAKFSYRYDLGKAKVYQSTTGREYVIFPTTFTMDDITINSHVVAIQDKVDNVNKWYIVRIESPAQIEFIKQAYPDITDIQIAE